MVDLTGHAAGNGGHSQGKPTAHRDLLYSDPISYTINLTVCGNLVRHALCDSILIQQHWPMISGAEGTLTQKTYSKARGQPSSIVERNATSMFSSSKVS